MRRPYGTLGAVLIVIVGLAIGPAAGVEIDGAVPTAAEHSPNPLALQTCDYTAVFSNSSTGVVLVLTGQGQGSGFVWQIDDGTSYVVTNEHVVLDNETVDIRFDQGETTTGAVVGTDPLTDLAVVKANETPDDVAALPLSERPARPGEAVAAVGSPFGLEQTITQGIVSGVNRTVPTDQGFLIPRSIQTDAAINPGNSGGPLLSCDGAVLGVNNAGGGEDIGFAISAAVVREVIPALAEEGRYEHAFLGIRTVPLDPLLVEANELDTSEGVYVLDVLEGSPASEVLQGSTDETIIDGTTVPVGGDVIVAVENRTITTPDDLLSFLLTERRPGDTVELTILRDEERQNVTVTLGERPEPGPMRLEGAT